MTALGALRLAAGGSVVLAALLAGAGAVRAQEPAARHGAETLRVHLKPLPPGVRRVELEHAGDGSHRYVLLYLDGTTERVSPDELASRLHAEAARRGFLYRLLNITSPIGFGWVALGLLGQLLFTGRMLVQWLMSERERRSVVPVAFWWMSLAGATMLLVYFVWRRDIVGVLGQSAGWMVYGRNLWLIHRRPALPTGSAAA